VGREPFSGHLDLLLLAALQTPRHGYGVIEHVRHASGGRFDYPDGTIYPALHRLEAEGFLRSDWSQVEGRRRRIYGITARGEKALAKHRDEWNRFTTSVTAVIEQAS
jgi:PadR family transcriptional regulator, regulatory protein PadR